MSQLPNHIRAWKKPAKVSDKSKAIKKLDEVFSDFVRLRDSDEDGIVACVICKDKQHWRDVDCGHYQDRDHMGTRWHEMNGNGECRICNRDLCISTEEYAKAIDEKYGPGTAAKLDKLAKNVTQWEDHELKKMHDYYRDQVKILKEQKGFI
jgi:hypothetical protein